MSNHLNEARTWAGRADDWDLDNVPAAAQASIAHSLIALNERVDKLIEILMPELASSGVLTVPKEYAPIVDEMRAAMVNPDSAVAPTIVVEGETAQ